MLARHLWAPIGVLCFPSVLFAQTPEFHYLHGGHAHGIQCVDDTPEDRCINVGDGGRIRYFDDVSDSWFDANVADSYRGHFRSGPEPGSGGTRPRRAVGAEQLR